MIKPEIIIFDMDGVVTSERNYIKTAELTASHILNNCLKINSGNIKKIHTTGYVINYYTSIKNKFLTKKICQSIKSKNITTNWDLASVLLFVNFLLSAKKLKKISTIVNPLKSLETRLPEDCDSLDFARENLLLLDDSFAKIAKINLEEKISLPALSEVANFIDAEISSTGVMGFEIYKHLNDLLSKIVGKTSKIFCRKNLFWSFSQFVFQILYNGYSNENFNKNLVKNNKNLLPGFDDGFIDKEKLIFPKRKIIATLEKLRSMGIRLGIATGRPLAELKPILQKNLVWDFFEQNRICTDDFRRDAELEISKKTGKQVNLSKPNPFLFLKAIFPNKTNFELWKISQSQQKIDALKKCLIVGDTPGDITASKSIGVPSVAVLTGVVSKGYEQTFLNSGAETCLDSVLDLPDFIAGT